MPHATHAPHHNRSLFRAVLAQPLREILWPSAGYPTYMPSPLAFCPLSVFDRLVSASTLAAVVPAARLAVKCQAVIHRVMIPVLKKEQKRKYFPFLTKSPETLC